MKTQYIYRGMRRWTGLILTVLFFSVHSMAQGLNSSASDHNEMTPLEKLVRGLPVSECTADTSPKFIKNMDFEKYVMREILLEKWMHNKEYWNSGKQEKPERVVLEDWMYHADAWKLIKYSFEKFDRQEEDPAIELAEWMYADEFIQDFDDTVDMCKLERWMTDRSYWVMKD